MTRDWRRLHDRVKALEQRLDDEIERARAELGDAAFEALLREVVAEIGGHA